MSHAIRPFGSYTIDEQQGRSWAVSLVASSGIYVALAITVALVGGRHVKRVAEKMVDLKFVEKHAIEPPPAPTPPPRPVEEPKAPAAAAPVVRPDQKIRRLEKPPPPKEMVAPRAMPTEAPREADPSQDKGVAVYGDGNKGDPAGLEGGVTQGGVVGGQVGGAIALPEDAVPPIPAPQNLIPPYPQEARAAARTGTVVLKVVILADGTVGNVQVLRGDEPFVSAALSVVKSWKYTPAKYKGQSITVYRIIQIPFKLTA